jgi:hypothetical protein
MKEVSEKIRRFFSLNGEKNIDLIDLNEVKEKIKQEEMDEDCRKSLLKYAEISVEAETEDKDHFSCLDNVLDFEKILKNLKEKYKVNIYTFSLDIYKKLVQKYLEKTNINGVFELFRTSNYKEELIAIYAKYL